MSRARTLPWYVPVIFAGLSGGALLVGFATAVAGLAGQPVRAPTTAMPAIAPRQGALSVVALGDSISDGVGDDRGGYPARVVAELEQRGRQPVLSNLSRPGAETADLIERLADPAVTATVRGAQLIMLSISGNDFTHAWRGRSGDGDGVAAFGRDAVATRVQRILALLRAANAEAPIRLVGLYNPFDVAVGAEAEARAELLAWNNLLEAATHRHRDVLVIPIADAFLARPALLAGDHFHPGPAGHALIAQRLLSTLANP